MAGLPVNTVMHGSPYNSAHKVSPVLLADLLREIQTLAGVNGTIVDIRDTLAGLTAVGLAEGEYGMVVTAADEAGIYEMSGGSLVRRAAVPAVFLESTASVQALAARDETETLRDQTLAYRNEAAASELAAEGAAGTASTQAGIATSAAQAAGAPIYADPTAGLAGVAEGEVFLVPAPPNLLVYTKSDGDAQPSGRLGEIRFNSVDEFFADASLDVTAGETVRAGVYFYTVAAASATDHHMTTAGGVKLYFKSGQRIAAEAFGISEANSAATNTGRFHTMWNFADGRPTYIGLGRYPYSGSYAGAVHLVGESAPTVNVGRTALENGSILVGLTNFSGDYVVLKNVGVDHGSDSFPSTGADAIKASASPYNGGRLCHLENVVGLGRSDSDAFHAVLVEGYEHTIISNVTGARNQYCGAIKSRNVNLNGFRGIEGQNILILKSDVATSGGSLAYLNATNITGVGSANTSHGLRLLADNAPIASVNISNVNITNSDRAVTVEAGTTISELNLNNINGKTIRLFGVVTSGSLYETNITNVNIVDVADGGRFAQFLSGRINATNLYGSMAAGGTTYANDWMRIESGVVKFDGDKIQLVENYGAGATVGVINIANTQAANRLSRVRAEIRGNRPQNGFSSQVLSGTSNVLTPTIDIDRGRSFFKISASADVSIININSILSGTTKLPEGYLVTIVPISSYNFTFVNSADLRNRSGNVVLTVNKSLTYIWGGTSWHQTDNT